MKHHEPSRERAVLWCNDSLGDFCRVRPTLVGWNEAGLPSNETVEAVVEYIQ